jgi:hypothetical protein
MTDEAGADVSIDTAWRSTMMAKPTDGCRQDDG